MVYHNLMTAAAKKIIRPGFTLIELLMATAIMLTITGLAIPLFTRSLRGARLREAGRTIVTAARYARNAAVLRQEVTGLLIDTQYREVDVVVAAAADIVDREQFLNRRRRRPGAFIETDASPAGFTSLFSRSLPQSVSFVEVLPGRTGSNHEGVYWVDFQPNGMSHGFSVHLQDDHGRSTSISIDGLSGRAKVSAH